ncbi:MAG: UDP-2,3-diacylglucosamine hydrolase [Arcobacter sp.]|nr:MAG: UDP-2,3-diacylglucosamine hydrolase [Arcobacter sp.]
MSHNLILQKGAILIADAHYSDKYPQFYSFLQAIESGTIQTTQLILMGDMFELLFGVIKGTKKDNEKEISLLNKIADKIEVIYFEGNHDFGLKSIFPSIKVFPLEVQPQTAVFGSQKVLLSHGDTKTPLGYQIYTKLIRNPFILSLIGSIDILCGHCIIKGLKSRGVQKDPCYKIPLFKEIIHRRLNYLKDEALDIVIEGHFHQNLSFNLYGFEYMNLASFACNQKYFIVQSIKEQLHLQEIVFSEKTN